MMYIHTHLAYKIHVFTQKTARHTVVSDLEFLVILHYMINLGLIVQRVKTCGEVLLTLPANMGKPPKKMMA